MIDHPHHLDTGDDISAEHQAIERRHIDRRQCLADALCQVRDCQAYLSALRSVDPAAVRIHLQRREA